MRRAWILTLVAGLFVACVPYELNPDAGPDAGDEGPDGGSTDGGQWIEFPDGGGGWVYPDGGATHLECMPTGDPKDRCEIYVRPDGGDYVPPRTDFPGSGQDGDPGTAVLFLIRIDRGTANLASRYEEMVQEALEQLAAVKLAVHSAGVASLYSGEMLWSAAGGTSLAERLAAAAEAMDGNPELPCTTQHLATLASQLPTYTDAFGAPVYGTPFSAFLVIVIDSGARPYQPSQSQCLIGSASAVDHFSTQVATWLANPAGRSLPRPQVQFVTVYTPEGITTAEAKTACSNQAGMDTSAIDSLEASPVHFFGPFTSGLNGVESGAAKTMDFCPEYASKWSNSIKSAGNAFVTRLRAQPKWE